MDEREILDVIMKGGVWSITDNRERRFSFKSYIYQRKTYIKLIEDGDKLVHLGYVEPNGQHVLNKKYRNTRRNDIGNLKIFLNELTRGELRENRWNFTLTDEELVASLYASVEEQKDERDWLSRLGI